MTAEEKQAIIQEYAIHEGDTGSPEVQIAILTYRIKNLTEHLKTNKKDNTAVAVCSRWLVTEETFSIISRRLILSATAPSSTS